MEARILMSGSVLRSEVHLYHSLGEVLNAFGRPLGTGCAVSSTLRMAEVGLQVLPAYEPDPRNSL